MVDTKEFLLIESNQIPLEKIDYPELKKNMINPTTGKPYKGMVLQGCFADLSNDTPNNNRRYYDIPTYLEFVKLLRKQIFSPKGVYGELEHPDSYAVNFNNVSHKIIDIWYDESSKKVMGIVLLLDTVKGKIAQEIINSGGLLAISARAAGEEKDNPDGTKSCRVKVLTTYDLVYHPGFSSAVLDFVELNESQKILQQFSQQKSGFSTIVYGEQLPTIKDKFLQYISLNENNTMCFYEWMNLNEAQQQDVEKKKDEKTIEDNESGEKDEIENKLSAAADKDLKESKHKFFQQVTKQQIMLKRKNQGKSYYDGSAGFMENENR